MRKLIGRLFGFHVELAELQEQIRELQWDRPFGMLTRGAFIQHCAVMPRGVRNIAFIDLDDINVLNDRYGYIEVNDRVRATFSVPFRRSDMVARWYSGDEIVILFDSDRQGAERKLRELRAAVDNAVAVGLYGIDLTQYLAHPLHGLAMVACRHLATVLPNYQLRFRLADALYQARLHPFFPVE